MKMIRQLCGWQKAIIGFLLILLVCNGIIAFKPIPDTSLSYDVFQVNDGWGYDILMGDEVLIHQPNVPGINKYLAFPSEKSAEKTAELVHDKIKSGEVPSVSIDEIHNLGLSLAINDYE
jgi:hypothetical protein